MSYVDGFLLPIAKENLEMYRSMAETAGKIWLEYGALDYKECLLDHDNVSETRPFTVTADAQENETVIMAYIVYKSREHRDEVNAKVMADPRLHAQCQDKTPFDWRRMSYAGFRSFVEFGEVTDE